MLRHFYVASLLRHLCFSIFRSSNIPISHPVFILVCGSIGSKELDPSPQRAPASGGWDFYAFGAPAVPFPLPGPDFSPVFTRPVLLAFILLLGRSRYTETSTVSNHSCRRRGCRLWWDVGNIYDGQFVGFLGGSRFLDDRREVIFDKAALIFIISPTTTSTLLFISTNPPHTPSTLSRRQSNGIFRYSFYGGLLQVDDKRPAQASHSNWSSRYSYRGTQSAFRGQFLRRKPFSSVLLGQYQFYGLIYYF